MTQNIQCAVHLRPS